jgi:hypothetical protein
MFRYRHPDLPQEEDTIPWGRVILAFALTIVVSLVLVAWAWNSKVSLERDYRPSGAFPERELGPRREVGMVRQELFDNVPVGLSLVLRDREELSRFGVADRERGLVSIPIDSAIELLVQERRR